jgi:protein required for attachment to host cells
MTKIAFPNGAWVVVADGRRALILQNAGDEKFANLQTVRVIEHENPPTREQGADRPGRYADTAEGHKSAFENTDWHDIEEERFLKQLAAHLKACVQKGECDKLILVAPPSALGVLRKALDAQVARNVLAELPKDLTNRPVYEIERALTS